MNPMRTTLSVILRLLIDEQAPGELRGMLQSISDGQVYNFEDEKTLLQLLHQQVEGFLRGEARNIYPKEGSKERRCKE